MRPSGLALTVCLALLAAPLTGCPETPSGPDATFPADLGLRHAPDEDGGAEDGSTALLTSAVGFQLDPAHSGVGPDQGLVPPLRPLFSIDLGGPLSYPLIERGTIFVVVGGGAGPRLFALDEKSGASRFGPIPLGGSQNWAALALDGGRLYALNADGALTAFDETSGTTRFTVTLPGGPGAFSAPPSAANGRVMATSGQSLFAVDGGSGARLWTAPIASGSHASAAIAPDGVYVTAGCAQASKLSPATGTSLWTHAESCSGPGGLTPLFTDGLLLVRSADGAGLLLSTATGGVAGSFRATSAPAAAGGIGLFLDGATLRATAVPSGTIAWTFTGDGTLRSPPIVSGGFVYIASGAGLVYGVEESSGRLAWTGTLPAPYSAPAEGDLSAPPSGLGAGGGLLVVPAGHLLSAYH